MKANTAAIATVIDKPQQLTLFDLEALETKVKEGMRAFIEVGNALHQIQEGRGWATRGYKSMEDYCEKELGFSMRHGQRQIAAASIATQVQQIAGEAPRNEAVAREFARVVYTPAKMQAVIKELGKKQVTVGNATATVVAKVIDKVLNVKPKSEPAKGKAEAATEPVEPLEPVDDWQPPPLPVLQDFCPHCGDIPSAYVRSDDGWHCPNCNGHVLLGVTLMTAIEPNQPVSASAFDEVLA